MGYSTLIYITVLAFIVFSCGSTNKKTNGKNTTDTTKVQSVKNDTVPNFPPPPQPAPAPGTMHVKGKIVGIHYSNNDSGITYDLKVTKILAMGASTPSVVQNDTLQVVSSREASGVKENMEVKWIINYKKVFGQRANAIPSWQLMKRD